MFGRFRTNYEEQLRLERERLQTMSEKELLIEMIFRQKIWPLPDYSKGLRVNFKFFYSF